jgi:hypothetical protein
VVPPTEPCALRSTQFLKVSTRDFSSGKGGRCVWLTNYHPCSAETSRGLNLPGTPWATSGHLGLSRDPFTYFPFYFIVCKIHRVSEIDKILSEILVNYAFDGRNLNVVLLTSLNIIPIYQVLSYYILFFHGSISHLVRNSTVGRTHLD